MENSGQSEPTERAPVKLPALFVIIPAVLFDDIRAERLKAIDLVTFGLLTAHARKGNEVYPSQARLAQLAGCTTKTIQRSLARLRDANHIIWQRGQVRTVNRTRLLSRVPPKDSPQTAPNRPPLAPDRTMLSDQ